MIDIPEQVNVIYIDNIDLSQSLHMLTNVDKIFTFHLWRLRRLQMLKGRH